MKKYIEQMADDLNKNCNAFCCGCSEEMLTIKFAECLYNAGYRKIEEGSIILTKEEQENKMMFEVHYRKEREKEVRKEVAKEILNSIKAMLVDRYDYFSKLRSKNIIINSESSDENALFDLGEMDCANCLIDKIKEFAKEYGVEVK